MYHDTFMYLPDTYIGSVCIYMTGPVTCAIAFAFVELVLLTQVNVNQVCFGWRESVCHCLSCHHLARDELSTVN